MKFAMITFAAAVGSANAGFTASLRQETLVAAPRPHEAPDDARMATSVFTAPGDARIVHDQDTAAAYHTGPPGDARIAAHARMATSVFTAPGDARIVHDTAADRTAWSQLGRWKVEEERPIQEYEHRIQEDEHTPEYEHREDERREEERLLEEEHRIQVEERRIEERREDTLVPSSPATMIQVGCDAESECMHEWRNQRWGDATHEKMCGDPEYHIDCRACSFCAREEEEEDVGQDLIDSEADSVVEEEHEEEHVGNPNFDGTNGNMHGIFDSSMFVDGCNPKTCPEWDCRMWCHCFKTNPNVELMFESVQYGETLARICPEDDTACNCDLE